MQEQFKGKTLILTREILILYFLSILPTISTMALPSVTLNELSDATQDNTINPSPKKVLEGLLNDYMDLQYGKETPYTTGKQVVPSGASIEDVDKSIDDESVEKKFRDIFAKISETEKSGDLTPQSKNDGSWDPKLSPVLVLIRPNN
ncbi:uncharacterized protein LOC115448517 [Manduca sexta]|uniref:Uncharacterized protein n=1 Tax=Manduca sexta TaxID=7130 RepID=A0A921ZJ05_MANSE|nr:uncharacterized protein LOC115448517 [Manduca sexta]KAG6457929.1 hypothetical protein O3G_MSEX010577 [Manduca sexta]KAG6457930.1 hypothetical protein O3G_MSEX010577 [Manduca sexta]